MERNIECSKNYNPYKVIDKFIQLANDYCFECSVVAHAHLVNSFTYHFDSGHLRFSIGNNTAHDNYFYVEIDHAEHMGHIYKRYNIELEYGNTDDILIERIKDVIHQYKDDLTEKSYRNVMIASIVD